MTPQQVKSASGIGTKADKAQLLKIASRIFKTKLKSHHEADAALAALAGILKHRQPTKALARIPPKPRRDSALLSEH